MARGGFSTSNYFSDSGLVTAVPLTIACWFRTNVTATPQHLAGFYTSGSVASRNCFRLILQSTDVVAASIGDASSGAQALSSTTFTSGTWAHAAGVWSTTSALAAYLNGGGKGTNTTSLTPSGIDRFGVGVGYGSSLTQALAPAGDGALAELGVWNVALDDAEIAVLAAGLRPLYVRPASLVVYAPLWGDRSPEINFLSSTGLTMNGTVAAAAHPRVLY